MPWTAVGTARIKAMLEERTLTEGPSARGGILLRAPGKVADRSKEGRDREASRKRVGSLRCCGNGPERVPYKWKQMEFCSLESHRLSESSVTKKGQRVEKVTKRRPQN